MSEETKATLDAAGGMPMLRGALEAFGAIGRVARWERRRSARDGAGPRRAEWAALAVDRRSWGFDETLDPLARAAAAPPRVALPERESLARLAAAGVPVTNVRAVAADDGGDAAVAAWRELGGGPVALKLDATELAHKTEAGGVLLGLGDEQAIRAAVGELRRAASGAGVALRGLLVEPMAAPGVEVIVGGIRDAVFGPAVLVGLGGILAEVLDDVAVLLAPVTAAEVRERLGTLRAAPILRGVRGRPGGDLDALARMVVAIGDLLVADPSIAEIDCNPVITGLAGAIAVDALVVVAEGGTA
jgi:acyl-CoA synthetase (NDP forming)